MKNKLTILALALLMSGCGAICKKQEPEIRYIDKQTYVIPDVPPELLSRESTPPRRNWTKQDLQGETVGRYITELNKALDAANAKLESIEEFLEKARENNEWLPL